jgi:hypothetical protein
MSVAGIQAVYGRRIATMLLNDLLIIIGLLAGFSGALCVGWYIINQMLLPFVREWRGGSYGHTAFRYGNWYSEISIEVQYRPSVSRIPVRI